MLGTYQFGDDSLGIRDKIIVKSREIDIDYPCANRTNCTYVSFILKPGHYLFELAGASGGIKRGAKPLGKQDQEDRAQSGGLVSGKIYFRQNTKIFVHVGGEGHSYHDGFEQLGGYNGGGGDMSTLPCTGGGSTDIRTEFNDYWHRILVAGGGGGSDDQDRELEINDGRGGAGGGLISQTFSVDGQQITGYEATQTYGFSFFYGETGILGGTKHPNGFKSSELNGEKAGAGGGWFGGFSSFFNNGGASGGSSFALEKNATIPKGRISVYDENYIEQDSQYYAYSPQTSAFLFTDVIHKRGIWVGNGYAKITALSLTNYCSKSMKTSCYSLFFFIIILNKT